MRDIAPPIKMTPCKIYASPHPPDANDENACPNRRQPESADNEKNDRRRRSSRRSMGTKVSKLAALFDGGGGGGGGNLAMVSLSEQSLQESWSAKKNEENSPVRRYLSEKKNSRVKRDDASTPVAQWSPSNGEGSGSVDVRGGASDIDIGSNGETSPMHRRSSEKQSHLKDAPARLEPRPLNSSNSSSGTYECIGTSSNNHSSNKINDNSSKVASAQLRTMNNDPQIKREREQRRRRMLQDHRLQKMTKKCPPAPRSASCLGTVAELDGGRERAAADRMPSASLIRRRQLCAARSERKVGADPRDEQFRSEGECLGIATAIPTTAEALSVEGAPKTSKRTASSDGARDENFPARTLFPTENGRTTRRALAFASRLVLLALALFEVLHRSPLALPAFGVVAERTGWRDALHVGFVGAFFVRALVASFDTLARRKWWPSKDKSGDTNSSYFRAILLLFFVASCWMALLPVFKDCGSETNAALRGQFCFFVEKSSTLRRGRFASRRDFFAASIPRYSLADLLAREWYKRTKAIIKSKIKGRLAREILRGLWRPFAFHGRLKKLFLFLRWAKFFGPLAGTCNKFRGRILDAIRKRRQRVASDKARKRWDDLLDALSKRSQSERAVLALQKRFRERRETRAKRRFALITPGPGTADRDTARCIRRRLEEVRESSRRKLERMDVLEGHRQTRRQVSADERRCIARHRALERRRRRRPILSPKTSFAVGWKFLTAACAALEMSQIAVSPMLSGDLKKMPLDDFLRRVLSGAPSSCDGNTSTISAPPSIFVPVFNGLGDATTCTIPPWKQLVTTNVILTVLVPIVNTIFFLDVFVTFFTGELSSSGRLVPKPPFQRYVLPGIGLQLLVNPTMVEISRMAKRTIGHVVHIGPSVCFHLFLACIPFVTYFYDCLLNLIFDFVEMQNMVVTKL